jgi:hypothetical protein
MIFRFRLVYTGLWLLVRNDCALFLQTIAEPIAHHLQSMKLSFRNVQQLQKQATISELLRDLQSCLAENGFKIIGDANYSPNVKQFIIPTENIHRMRTQLVWMKVMDHLHGLHLLKF